MQNSFSGVHTALGEKIVNVSSLENALEEFALKNPHIDTGRILNLHLRNNAPNIDILVMYLFILGKCDCKLK